jgi:hypothetical protein
MKATLREASLASMLVVICRLIISNLENFVTKEMLRAECKQVGRRSSHRPEIKFEAANTIPVLVRIAWLEGSKRQS